MNTIERFLPLNPATLHILVVLAAGERHGCNIMQEVERQSRGQYRLSAGTLNYAFRSSFLPLQSSVSTDGPE